MRKKWSFPDEKNIILKKYCQYCKIFFPFQKPVPLNLWRRLEEIDNKIALLMRTGCYFKPFILTKTKTLIKCWIVKLFQHFYLIFFIIKIWNKYQGVYILSLCYLRSRRCGSFFRCLRTFDPVSRSPLGSRWDFSPSQLILPLMYMAVRTKEF